MASMFLENLAAELGVSPEKVRECAKTLGLPLGTLTSPATGSKKITVIHDDQAAQIRQALGESGNG